MVIGATLPVELGFVQSLARSGGNVTGTTAPAPETAAKAIQVLNDVAAVLERIAASRSEMLFVAYDGVTESRLRDITSFAIRHRIVSIGPFTLFTTMGGAIYYGSNLQAIIDRSMSFVDRILRGAKPADLPVEEPTRFDLILNLKTFRAIGITVAQSVRLRAVEVIQ